MSAEPLGAELNRCQRIFDLVCEPPCDLTPCRDLLRPNERRHVVQDEHEAFARAAVADERCRHRREMELLALSRNGDFLRRRLRLSALGTGDERADWLQIRAIENGASRLAHNRPIEAQEPRGSAVDGRNGPSGID